MRTILLGFTLIFATITTANAGFERWTAETKKNPFSGGVDVSVLYNLNRDAQIQVNCDSAKQGITITAIPGYEASSDSLAFKPTIRFAVDGEIILSDIAARTAAYGANLLGVVIELTKENADKFTDGLLSAKRQIAIEDGMSTEPFLLTAKGSTAAAQKVKQCYQAQKGVAPEPTADDDAGKIERIAEIKLEVEKLTNELKELEQ